MRNATRLIIAIAGLSALGGCASARYPVLPAAWNPQGQALSCGQLNVELEKARQTQIQIEDIAAGRARNVRPILYSTDRADADRAVQARLSEVEGLRRTQNCPG
jgi:hypothetical protein